MIILLFSFLGELLKYVLPFPVPASIYGLVLLFIALETRLLPLAAVKDAGKFMIEIMPLMFIPAGAGLIDAWDALRPICVQIVVIMVVSTIVVMIVSRSCDTICDAQREKERSTAMKEFLCDSVFFGVAISILAYELGVFLKKKLKLAVFNPLLISIVAVIVFLVAFHIPYESYNEGAKYLSYLLTPATVCLAIPLYEQFELLKQNVAAIFAGLISGVLTSVICVLVLSLLFHFDHAQYVTLLPKSITTAIGMGISDELGGYVTITVAVIIITGIIGNVLAETICRVFKIEESVAKGIAIGSSSHALGTAKALELGEIEGAMSSLSIAVAGILTVIAAPIFATLL